MEVSGGDFLDQTPVLDVKPYINYADRIDNAASGWLTGVRLSRPPVKVLFDSEVLAACKNWESSGYTDLIQLIRETLALDPRPSNQIDQPDASRFGCRIFDLDVRWSVEKGLFRVTHVEKLTDYF